MREARAEFKEQPEQDYSLDWDGDEEDMLDVLNHEQAVNVLVSFNGEIVLSMDSHSEIKKHKGLDDDQVLLEGLAETRGGHIYIDSNFHGASKIAEKYIPEIENKLNDEILPLLKAA
jgi:uncharacterized protein YjiK